MRVFLSAVSSQFQECRNQVASDLRATGHEVVYQEDFRQGDTTLLAKLEALVAGCERVIALIGDAYGYEPPNGAAPGGAPRRSYTQWEYFFALGERLDGSRAPRKPVFVYVASDAYVKDHPVSQSDDVAGLQREFIAHIKSSGEDRSSFGSRDELGRLVLRDGWRLEAHPRRPQNLPFPSIGALFKGRDEFLDTLRRRFLNPDGTARIPTATDRTAALVPAHAIHGLGGVGKTRLAVEFAWRHRDAFTALLFITADTPASLHRNLAALTGPLVLDLPEQDDSEDRVKMAAALRWLAQHQGWFLIVDNVDTLPAAEAIEDILTRLTTGHVLLTSRRTDWSHGVEPLKLDVLDEKAAVSYLLEAARSRLRQVDDAEHAAALARDLDGLALALAQAAAYVNTKKIALAEYRLRFAGETGDVLDFFDARKMLYPKSVAVTWLTTFEQLSARARDLLALLGWLAPELIPEWLLEAEENLSAERREALAELLSFSLAERSEDDAGFAVHRLVQEVSRRREGAVAAQVSASPEAGPAGLRAALACLAAALPGNPQDVRAWGRWNPLQSHVAMAVTHAAGFAVPCDGLTGSLGVLLSAKALHTEAEPLLRRALAIAEQTYGPDDGSLAPHLNNLALMLQDTNRPAEAERLMRRALTIAERSYGSQNPKIAAHLGNLAYLLQDMNRLREAEPLKRRALAIAEASQGPEHPEVAIHLNNLAEFLGATNRLREAEPLLQRTLRIAESSYGPEHPNVATALNNLALLLQATNRLAEAEPMMRQALAIDERGYGLEHPEVGRDLNNLGRLLHHTNRPAEAEPLLRRALGIAERNFGPEHPRVAISLDNLARLLRDTNRLAEAESLLQRALAIDERSHGPEHPMVAIHLNGLALLLQATNRLAEAEPLLRRALAIAERSYSREHPELAIHLNSLAALLQARNRLAEAEPLSRRALGILLRFSHATGHEHPGRMHASSNFGRLLSQMGLSPAQIEQQMNAIADEATK